MEITLARQPELRLGPNSLAGIGPLLASRGLRRVFLVAGGHFLGGAELPRLRASLEGAGLSLAGTGAVAGEPSPELVDGLATELRSSGAEAVLAVGGGSVLDAGKALSATPFLDGSIADWVEGVGSRSPEGRRLVLACAPTTAGTGSEATKNAVLSRHAAARTAGAGVAAGWKRSLRHEGYIPDLALLDPLLQAGCPASVTAASGLDAVTQLIEPFCSATASPGTDMLCLEGLRAAGRSLERAVGDGGDLEARAGMAWAAYLSGVALANAGVGVVHGLSSALGASTAMPHGLICGLYLGPALEALIRKARSGHERGAWFLERATRAARAFLGEDDRRGDAAAGGGDEAPERLAERLSELSRAWGLKGLQAWGLGEAELPALAAASDNKNAALKLDAAEREALLRTRLSA